MPIIGCSLIILKVVNHINSLPLNVILDSVRDDNSASIGFDSAGRIRLIPVIIAITAKNIIPEALRYFFKSLALDIYLDNKYQ